MSTGPGRRDSAAVRAAQARRRQRSSHTVASVPDQSDHATSHLMPSPRDPGAVVSSRAPPLPPSTKTKTTTPAHLTAANAATPASFQTARSVASTPSRHTTAGKDGRNWAHTSVEQSAPTATATTARTPPLRPQNLASGHLTNNTSGKLEVSSVGEARRKSEQKAPVDDQEEKFVDQEPGLSEDRTLSRVNDAACLRYGSLVMLRPRSQPTRTLTVQQQVIDEKIVFLLSANGLSLGTKPEAFQVVRAKGDSHPDRQHSKCQDENDSMTVHYGDTVILRSVLAQRRALGARVVASIEQQQHRSNPTPTYTMGCFRRTGGLAEQWTVRSPGHVVAIGRAAVHPPKAPLSSTPTATVRSGDCIVLRNNATGGLLSFDSIGGALTLLTHSYGTIATGSLIDRLQHHDRMLPSSDACFQMTLVSSPPCALWTGSKGDRRISLDGDYLISPERNMTEESSDPIVFGDTERIDSLEGLHGLAPLLFQSAPAGDQEAIILDEIVGSLLGLQGRYIHVAKGPTWESTRFCISDDGRTALPSGLCRVAERILTLSSGFVRVRAFVSSHSPGYEYGLVMQALIEALDEMLEDYVEFVGQLDAHYRSLQGREFGLNMLYVYIQTPLEAMSVLEAVIAAAQSRIGGALLNALVELKTTVLGGDSNAQKVLGILLEKASVPYMSMLNQWLLTGILRDATKEFMVDRRISASGDTSPNYDGDVWNELFVLVEENAFPDVVSSAAMQKVLMTGRYWNAVKFCRAANNPMGTDGPESSGSVAHGPLPHENTMNTASISSFIDMTYHLASKTLIDLLLSEYKLSETLEVLKRYFLLDQGDFLVHFLDSAEHELAKEVDDIAFGRIRNWLTTSVHLTSPLPDELGAITFDTSCAADRSREPLSAHSLTFKFASGSLVDKLDDLHAAKGGIDARDPKTPSRHPYGLTNSDLTGMETFVIDFEYIPFPTSLVISNRALESYQLLFRHIFTAKQIERRLVSVWFDHQMMKELQGLRGALGPTYCLRQRMLHFMQNLIYYMMSEVVEPNWQDMMDVLGSHGSTGKAFRLPRTLTKAREAFLLPRTVTTVDDIIALHMGFLRRTCDECLLSNRSLVRSLSKLMTTCRLFSEQMKRFVEKTKLVIENQLVANQKRNGVQRNLNDPDSSRIAQNKKLLRKKMAEDRDDRARRLALQTVRVERELANESYKKMISRYDEVFTDDLRDFLEQLQASSDDQYQAHRLNLCIRLDYNGFVTGKMGLKQNCQ